MSIRDAVDRLVNEEHKLVLRPSSYDPDIFARELFITPELYAVTMSPFADTEEGERLAALAQDFDAFAELNEITVAQNPKKKPRDVMLARTDPPDWEFWSMRTVVPEGTAGIRVLGGFCGLDAFVALTWDYRENIGAEFDDEVGNLADLWKDYFGGVPPHSGATLDAYLTNYDEK